MIDLNSIPIYLQEDHPDCYSTIFRFSQEYQNYCHQNKSVSGYKGIYYSDTMFFDIDCKDLGQAFESMMNLVSFLKGTTGQEETIKVFFSGSKGFHFHINSNYFGGFEPSENLSGHFKKLAQLIINKAKLNPSHFDLKVYERNRLWRLPNSKHRKTGFYKIQWNGEDLETLLETSKIKQGQSYYLIFNPSQTSPPIDLSSLWNEAQRPSKTQYNSLGIPSSEKSILPRCIQNIMNPENVEKGNRNETLTRIISFFQEQGLPGSVVKSMVHSWNSLLNPPSDETEVNSTFHSVWEHGYRWNCQDPLRQSYCVSNCPRANITEIEIVNSNILGPEIFTLSDGIEKLQSIINSGTIIRTGIDSLDKAIWGLMPQDIITIMGRPGTYKSSMLQLLFSGMAKKYVNPVVIFTMEMSLSRFSDRFLQLIGRLPKRELWKKMRDREIEDLTLIAEEHSNLYIVEKPSLNFRDIESYVNRIEGHTGKNCYVIGIDFIQIGETANRTQSSHESQYGRATTLMREMKSYGKDTNRVIFLLSQVSRSEGGDGTKPLSLSSGRGSGVIEEVSDHIWGLYKEADKLVLQIIKNKEGAAGMEIYNLTDPNQLVLEPI